MNQQTRRDLAYTRNYQEWVEALLFLEAEARLLDSRYADITTEDHPDTERAGADYDELARRHGPVYRQCACELGGDMLQRAREDARALLAVVTA